MNRIVETTTKFFISPMFYQAPPSHCICSSKDESLCLNSVFVLICASMKRLGISLAHSPVAHSTGLFQMSMWTYT